MNMHAVFSISMQCVSMRMLCESTVCICSVRVLVCSVFLLYFRYRFYFCAFYLLDTICGSGFNGSGSWRPPVRRFRIQEAFRKVDPDPQD